MTLYQPFLDYAIPLLTERLDLAPYPIPAGFESKECITGKGKKEQLVVTTSHAFKSSKLRQIRAAHVQGGDALQVLNFVIFPQINYDLPFFGADLVTLPGGHLIALDMQPLFHDSAYQKQYSDPISPIFNKYQTDLPWGGDFPEEAKPFFSPAFLWTRPKETEAVQTTVFAALTLEVVATTAAPFLPPLPPRVLCGSAWNGESFFTGLNSVLVSVALGIKFEFIFKVRS